MDKLFIKQRLRESLEINIIESESDKKSEKGEKDDNKTYDDLNKYEKSKVKSLSNKIKNVTQGSGKLLKLSQVMDAAGVGDANDASDRSAIGKAVSGKPDADGNIRHLTLKQANAMGKVVDNPIAFK